jgi:Family of unknown function (DUF6152)
MVLVAVQALRAHHSFAAEFDADRTIRITGTLVRVDWTNPHSYFRVEVQDEKGAAVVWICEGAPPAALSRNGFRRGDLKAGDRIVIEGYPARDGSHLLDVRRILLESGRVIFRGSPPVQR